MAHENEFYQRQSKLSFVGEDGQKKLKNARVLVIGAGGLGHPVAAYLAGSGVGTITISDFDVVSFSNLHRQFLFNPENVGEKKIEPLVNFLKKQNPFITIVGISQRINAANIEEIFKDHDYIIDCCDNLETKFLVHDYSFKKNKTLIQGAIDQIEGEIRVFDFKDPSQAPCLRCLWQQQPQNDCVQSCSEVGVLSTTAGVFGTLMANELIKSVLNFNQLPNGTTYQLNLATLESRKIKWKKNGNCPLCRPKSKPLQQVFSASALELNREAIEDIKEFQIVDVTEKMLLPHQIQHDKKYLLVCAYGVNSLRMTRLLRNEGLPNVWSLAGGKQCL